MNLFISFLRSQHYSHHTSHDRMLHKGGVRARISKYRETGLYDLSEILGIQISPPRHEVQLCEVFSETFGEGATIQAPIHQLGLSHALQSIESNKMTDTGTYVRDTGTYELDTGTIRTSTQVGTKYTRSQ